MATRAGGGAAAATSSISSTVCARPVFLSLPEALARFPLELYNPHDTVRDCHGTNGFCNQHEVNGEQLSLPPPSSPFTSGESPCPSLVQSTTSGGSASPTLRAPRRRRSRRRARGRRTETRQARGGGSRGCRCRGCPSGCSGAAQAAAQAAQAAALERYRLVNAWFYPRGDWFWYTLYWDGSSADKVARRAVFPTLEHDDYARPPRRAHQARQARAVRPLLRRLLLRPQERLMRLRLY